MSALVLVLVLVLALGLWAAAGGAPAAAASLATPPEAPLAATWTTAQGTWAVVAMGELKHLDDTFWEMFFRPDAGNDWSLVTPTGAADNGGLVADDGPAATVVAGIEPSQALTYSPVAQTTTDGRTWSPGLLPVALLPVPDAVAIEGDGSVLALVRTADGSLVGSKGNLSSWQTLARLRSLAGTGAGRSCGLVALRAVTVADGAPRIGGACTKPGVVGVFTQDAGSWQLRGPRLPGAAGKKAPSVLRLRGGPGGTAGLVEAGRGSTATLFAMWRTSLSAGWSLSPPLRLRGRLVSTGFGPSASMVVVTGGAKGADKAESVAGPGAAWVPLPAPPKGTAAVAAGPGGTIDALAVATSDLVDWRLDASTDSWSRSQELVVPIQYGSST
jgi:hypothetical protein